MGDSRCSLPGPARPPRTRPTAPGGANLRPATHDPAHRPHPPPGAVSRGRISRRTAGRPDRPGGAPSGGPSAEPWARLRSGGNPGVAVSGRGVTTGAAPRGTPAAPPELQAAPPPAPKGVAASGGASAWLGRSGGPGPPK
ncbi:hypothetical protein J1605_003771 [Eschrichtius robustus]|uniref:Uncharacterized protein n=1 Tax=Eschrichtius robustus TaxID=9764 RepID=A0AB34HNN1_ESCRO|nr:hypothetical protein J1605_003771 [Eschrichtius robustus]